MELLCVKCKGRGFCGKACKWSLESFKNTSYKKDFSGTSPAVFVGQYNYPNVFVGIMSPQFQTIDAKSWDDPATWSKTYTISQVVEKRQTLINSRTINSVKKVSESFITKMQEVALSTKPLDIEVSLSKAPRPLIKYDFISNPMGPSANVERLDVCTNAKIKTIVQKCYSDSDLKSMQAIKTMYEHEVDETSISRILSSGALGVKKERKLVPTRWSITAVDDGIGKQLISTIKNYTPIDNYRVLNANLFGNYFTIILPPSVWSYELFETTNGVNYTHDFEGYDGRSEYAYNTAGGYYASRLAVLEYLAKIKRQASAIVLRQITNEYYCPLGVWVVRQAARKTHNSVNCFNSEEEMKQHLRLVTPVHNLLARSESYNEFKTQKRLSAYL